MTDELTQEIARLRDLLNKEFAAREQAESELEDLQFTQSPNIGALHLLHEQAHGPVPWTTCQIEPCRSLPDREHGPAVSS